MELATAGREKSAAGGAAAGMAMTRALLVGGVIAGPFYIEVGAIQILIRPGFDMRVNALSQMSLGALGWIQVTNFVVGGLLVLGSAAGMRRLLQATGGGPWGPILVAIYGLGLIAASVFSADPGFGFPPGTPSGPPHTLSTHGILHFASAGIGFLALIAACLVFARRFSRRGQRGMASYSLFTGIVFLATFAATASGQIVFLPGLWVGIFLAWVWLSVLSAQLLSTAASVEV